MTCHGDKAVENKFKMPNAELPKLPAPTDRAGFMALMQKKPDSREVHGHAGQAGHGEPPERRRVDAHQPEGVRLLRLPHLGGRARGRSRGRCSGRTSAKAQAEARRRRLVSR